MEDPDAIHLVAKVFARSGDIPRAVRYLSRLSERYIALGDLARTTAIFEDLIDDSDPDLRAEAAFRLDQLALKEDRELDAQASFQSSVSGPFAEDAYNALKKIYEQRNDGRSLYRLEKQLASRSNSEAEALEHHLRTAGLARDEKMGAAVIQNGPQASHLAVLLARGGEGVRHDR